jgi:hypothetical protein
VNQCTEHKAGWSTEGSHLFEKRKKGMGS